MISKSSSLTLSHKPPYGCNQPPKVKKYLFAPSKRISSFSQAGSEVWGVHAAQLCSHSAAWDKNKRLQKTREHSREIKWGFTDLWCHLLYEVNGVIYVEADHAAQWNLWWWKEQRKGRKRTGRLITVALGRGYSFSRKLIKNPVSAVKLGIASTPIRLHTNWECKKRC